VGLPRETPPGMQLATESVSANFSASTGRAVVKRRNVQQAFTGEPDPTQEGIEAAVQGEDAVEIEIRGGRLLTTVDHTTPDDAVLEHHGYLSGELVLEDGRRLTFEIQDGAVGAQWSVTDVEQEHFVGLSALDNPGGV